MDDKKLTDLAEQIAADLADDQKDAGALVRAPKAVDYAMQRAQIAYLTDFLQRPVEHFFPLVAQHLTRGAYLRQVRVEQWEQQRGRLFAQVQQLLLKKLTDAMVTDRMKELTELRGLRKDLLDLALPDKQSGNDGRVHLTWKVEPKSLEGVVKAFVDVSRYMDDTRSQLAQVVQANTPMADYEIDDGPLEHEDAVLAVRKVLEQRLVQQDGGDGNDD